MYALPVLLLSLFIGSDLMAQHPVDDSHHGRAQADSLAAAERNKDSHTLSDLKATKKDTEAKATEARRVERDANDAARESKIAYRSERKAQVARKKADKQARKAAKARGVSDGN